jgi:hypothetical protein
LSDSRLRLGLRACHRCRLGGGFSSCGRKSARMHNNRGNNRGNHCADINRLFKLGRT